MRLVKPRLKKMRNSVKAVVVLGLLGGVFSATSADSLEVTSLEMLLAQIKNNPSVEIAESNAKVAGLERNAARWKRYPTLSYSMQDKRRGAQATTVSLEQPIWSGGAISAEIRASEFKLAAFQSRADETQQNIIGDIGLAYIDLRRVSDAVAQANENLDALKQLEYTISRRVAAKVSPRSDQTTVSARIAQAQSEVVGLREEAGRQREKLFELTGVEINTVNRLACDVPSDVTSGDLIRQAMAYSPRLRRLKAEIGESKGETSKVRAEFAPRLVVGVEHAKEENVAIPEDDTKSYLAVRYTLADGISNFSKLSAAKQRTHVKSLEVVEAKRALRETVASAYLAFRAAQNQLPPLSELVSLNRLLIVSYLEQYKVGKRTWLDVVNAQRELNQSASKLISVQASLCTNAFKLQTLSNNTFVRDSAS